MKNKMKNLQTHTKNIPEPLLSLLSLQPYESREFEIPSCRQHGFCILLW